jgi:hypothetical protein
VYRSYLSIVPYTIAQVLSPCKCAFKFIAEMDPVMVCKSVLRYPHMHLLILILLRLYIRNDPVKCVETEAG